MHEAKSRLSELAQMVLNGEKVVIARAGKPILDLVPHVKTKRKRLAGGYEKEIEISDDFDETPLEIINAFYGDGNG
ncbi:type II toxin-antitoxin system prevent-host-death family antitoxin [bacterium]|nr:type II toxin-antitoxin system prevent-host-death family antitoxin [bacterium]